MLAMTLVNIRRVIIMALLAGVTGCMFSDLEKDLQRWADITHEFNGAVTAAGYENEPVVVAATLDREGSDVIAVRVLSRPGKFGIVELKQPMYFFAFIDLNHDMAYQENEPFGAFDGGRAVDPDTEATDSLVIDVLPPDENRITVPMAMIGKPLTDMTTAANIIIGSVTPLDNPLFSLEHAKKGLWQPFAFIEDGGAGVHFLEPYSPRKTMVLLVHGINGAPQNFTYLINNLDPDQYQFLVFSYPSGLRLQTVANGLFQMMEILEHQYGFNKVHLVAHSMGGLVSRGYVNICAQRESCRYLESYTTIATPWGGAASAKSGIQYAPTPVPVWIDLDPASEYLTTLFDTPLPHELPYYLFFSYKRDNMIGAENTDGAVTLSSQLRSVAQAQSRRTIGYNEGHVEILNSESVKLQLQNIFLADD